MSASGGSVFGGKKVFILILGLSLTAASCDINALFNGTGGTQGIFRSEDAGETFKPANALAKKGDIGGVSANSLAFDSSNPDNLYLGASNGIFKSTDSAKSWRYILANIAVADLAVDPYQSNIIYAAGVSGSNGKIIKSLDGGTSWADIYTEPSKNNPVLAVAVSSANNQVVLAGLLSGEIIRSVDAGHTWQAAKDFSSKISAIVFGPNGTAYALTTLKGLNKSSDLGITWTNLTDSLTGDNFYSSADKPTSVNGFTNLALDRKQSGVLYLGTDRGLFRSVNDGGSWSFMALPVKNASLLVSAVAVNPGNSNNLFVSIGHILFKSLNGGVTWETKVMGTNAIIKIIQINSVSNNIIYVGFGS